MARPRFYQRGNALFDVHIRTFAYARLTISSVHLAFMEECSFCKKAFFGPNLKIHKMLVVNK